MDEFKSISIEDKQIFDKFYKITNTNSYEYLFSSLYIWSELYETKYIIFKDVLIVKKYYNKNKYFFMMPFGYNKENLDDIILFIKSISNYKKTSILTLNECEKHFIYDLKTFTEYKFKTSNNINSFEYVYLTKDLINLEGKKYHKKRNHINNFIKNYKYEVKNINTDDIKKDCLNLVTKWENSKNISSKELLLEYNVINKILNNIDTLKLSSIALYSNNTLVGFSIGEIISDTAIIHIEKCDKSFLGAYAFLNREFLIKNFKNTIYVNREEDCGDIGLRKSKQSYYPNKMIEKYLIRIF